MTHDHKQRASRIEDRLLHRIDRADRRHVTIRIPRADLRRAVSSLDARAVFILARMSKDPVLRKQAECEAMHCRRLAVLLTDVVRAVSC